MANQVEALATSWPRLFFWSLKFIVLFGCGNSFSGGVWECTAPTAGPHEKVNGREGEKKAITSWCHYLKPVTSAFQDIPSRAILVPFSVKTVKPWSGRDSHFLTSLATFHLFASCSTFCLPRLPLYFCNDRF